MKVSGLSISDIMNIDLNTFNRMNESELRSITSRLVSAGNKRIRRLLEHDVNSPAIRSLGDDKEFSTKIPAGLSPQQRVNYLRSEFARIRDFLTSETSTIRGYNKFVNRTTRRIAQELHLSPSIVKKNLDVNRMFDLLHKAQQSGFISSYRGSKGSVQARNVIAEILIDNPGVSNEKIMDWLEQESQQMYEDEQEELEDETEEFDL